MVRSVFPGALIRTEFIPPCPFGPWQTSHFCAKITAPSADVPLPGGKPLPSGPMLMSQSARSASLIFWPSPGGSASAAPAQSANAKARANGLAVDMLGLPLVVDRPARDDVHVAHRERNHGDV